MANDTFRGIAGKVLLRCPSATLTLAQDWVQSAFRDIVERRRWSWLLKKSELFVYDQYATGTATVTAGTQTVTLNAPGAVASAHVGRQFRVGTTLPITTITAISTGANTYTVDQVWWPTTVTAQSYSVYQAYVTLPSDFHSFESVIDPNYAQPVTFGLKVSQLDNLDPQRAASGSPPKGLAYLDYYASSAGAIAVPRYELWPHQRSAAVYPIVYESRPTDPFDANATVPALLPSDVVLERTMMYCSAWPGPDATNRNPYFSKEVLALHKTEFERRIAILEKQDNEHMQQNLWYQADQQGGSIISASWLQNRAIGRI